MNWSMQRLVQRRCLPLSRSGLRLSRNGFAINYAASTWPCHYSQRRSLSLDTRRIVPRRSVLAFPFCCGSRRTIFSALPGYFVPPAVFISLVLVLWVYKCFMMIIFQNKIIYMPSVPPFSRRETIQDYAPICSPIGWQAETIRSLDGTKITICIGKHESRLSKIEESSSRLVILYFQGNASSTPPRLPSLSAVLKLLSSGQHSLDCTIIALSYRGFWTSSGRASQPGIERDAAAAIKFALDMRERMGPDTKLVLWGQSIGAGIATTAAANHLQKKAGQMPVQGGVIDGLILETPFMSIRKMLTSLYPQKWLPYRYLWPFLRNWWDTGAALRVIQQHAATLPILCVTAEKDEVVSLPQAEELVELCKELAFNVSHHEVKGALHTEAMTRHQGRAAVVDFLRRIASPH